MYGETVLNRRAVFQADFSTNPTKLRTRFGHGEHWGLRLLSRDWSGG
jgi:hypothetical protein